MLLSETSSYNSRHYSENTTVDEKHSTDPNHINFFDPDKPIQVNRRY